MRVCSKPNSFSQMTSISSDVCLLILTEISCQATSWQSRKGRRTRPKRLKKGFTEFCTRPSPSGVYFAAIALPTKKLTFNFCRRLRESWTCPLSSPRDLGRKKAWAFANGVLFGLNSSSNSPILVSKLASVLNHRLTIILIGHVPCSFLVCSQSMFFFLSASGTILCRSLVRFETSVSVSPWYLHCL